MLWFYLALFNVVGSAVSNIFRRVAMTDDKNDAIASAIIFQIIGAIIVGIFAMLHGFILPPIAKYPFNVIIQAILWGSATLSLFKASQHLEASESAIITAGSAIVTIIGSVILLHEHFGLVYVLGTFLILSSIFYMFYRNGKPYLNKGVMYALFYCVLAGLGFTNDAFMLKFSHSDPLSLLTLGFFAPGIFLALIRPTALKKIKPILQISHFKKVFLLTFFYALTSIAYFFAIATGGQASQVAPISQSAIIVTVLFGAIFLGERDQFLKKIICTALVTIGVILLR